MVQSVTTPVYRKPYPEWIDREFEFPRGFRVPEFTLFAGDGTQSTIEYTGRFTGKCGEVGNNNYHKLRLFASSLTGVAFSWYVNLPAGLVASWQQLEGMFCAQFLRIEPEVTMADLARLRQSQEEHVSQYIYRFKKLKNRCRVNLPEAEFVKLAQNGLTFELRKKFDDVDFRDLFELTSKVSRYGEIYDELFRFT